MKKHETILSDNDHTPSTVKDLAINMTSFSKNESDLIQDIQLEYEKEEEDFEPYQKLEKIYFKHHLIKRTEDCNIDQQLDQSCIEESKKVENKEIGVAKNSIYDMIENEVVPKWKSYMIAKTKRRENSAKLKPRNDTLWK